VTELANPGEARIPEGGSEPTDDYKKFLI